MGDEAKKVAATETEEAENSEELEIEKTTPAEKRDLVIVALAVCVLTGVMYLLFFAPSISWFQNSKQIGTIETGSNVIRRRHGGNLTWGDVRGIAPLYLHDIVYIPKGGSATIALGNKSMRLPEDTMVQFDEDFAAGNFEVKLLEVPKVPALPLPLRITKLGNLLAEVQPLELRLQELKARTLEKVFAQLSLVRVSPLEFKDLPAFAVEDYGIKTVAPVEDRYNLRVNRWMKMSWTKIPVKDVTYHVEISKDRYFNRILPHTTKNTQLLVQFDDEATYYWRVRAVSGGKEILSNNANFTMAHRGGKSQRQIAVEIPKDNPKGYPVEIAGDAFFNNILRTLIQADPSCPDSGLPGGTYYCRVRGPKDGKVLKTYQFKVR